MDGVVAILVLWMSALQVLRIVLPIHEVFSLPLASLWIRILDQILQHLELLGDDCCMNWSPIRV